MQTTCPNCRHAYQNELHSFCPPCYEEKLKCPMPDDISPSKQQKIRKIASGGGIISNENSRDNSDNAKTKKDVHSPTASLSFLLPPVSLFAKCNAFTILDEKFMNSFYNSEDDLKNIATSQKLLKLSGWYHQKLSWKDAINLLMPTPVGTFLIRDSSDCKYLYSLSVQTKCGPTSIRIHYAKGEFRLDSDQTVAQYMPKFSCLIKLIQFYVESTKELPLKCLYEDNQIWIDCLGLRYSQIVVSTPLYIKGYFPSLKHLSRLCINKNLVDTNLRTVVPAPSFVINYLLEYPYKY